MPYRAPTVFIGVGGLGQAIVSETREKIRRLWEAEKSFDAERFQFLAMDPVPTQVAAGADDGFPSVKHFKMAGFTMATVNVWKQQPGSNVKEWWYPSYNCVPCEIGYNGIRVNGRFGLVSCSQEANMVIAQSIHASCSAGSKGKGAGSPDLMVCICGSLSGGTGSGVMLDLGFLVKEVARQNNKVVRVYGLFGLPEVVGMATDVTLLEGLQANGYAFLKELNWYMATPGKDGNVLRKVFYKQKFDKITVDESAPANPTQKPFDRCYFISSQSLDGANLKELPLVRRMASQCISLLTAGSGLQEYIVNQPPPDLKIGVAQEIRPVSFGGFGSYSIRFPANNVASYLSAQAAASLIGSWVMKAPNDEADAAVLFDQLRAGEDWPLEVQAFKKRIEAAGASIAALPPAGAEKDDEPQADRPLPPPKTAYEDDIGTVHKTRFPLQNFVKQVVEGMAKEYSVKGNYALLLAGAMDRYGMEVQDRIKAEVDKAFAVNGPKNGLCVAAVYLGKIKKYCEGLVGSDQAVREAFDAPTLAEQATTLKRRLRTIADGEAPEIQELANAYPSMPPFGMARWCDSVGTFMASVVNDYRQVLFLEAASRFYRQIRDYADALKMPIRFIQVEAAEKLKARFERHAGTALIEEDVDLRENGVEEVLLGRADEVDSYVKPRVSLFDRQAPKRQAAAEQAALSVVLPKLKEYVEELWSVLANTTGRERFLAERRELIEDRVEQIIVEPLRASVMEDLHSRMTVAHALLLDAGAKGKDPGTFVRNLLVEDLSARGARVFCGFSQSAIKAYKSIGTEFLSALSFNGEAFDKAVQEELGSRKGFQVKTLQPHGIMWETDSIDVFRLSVFSTVRNIPIFALSKISEYGEAYARRHTEEKAAACPLHTDRRFEPWELENDYTLPAVEVIEANMDDAVFLFILSEQDWWKGLKGFPNTSDIWAGDLEPLVAKSEGQRHYYTWRGPKGEDSDLGRSNAQLAFFQDRKGLCEEIRQLLAARWNAAYSEADKKEKLVKLMNDKNLAATGSSYNDLRRAYSNEARIIKERLARKAYNL